MRTDFPEIVIHEAVTLFRNKRKLKCTRRRMIAAGNQLASVLRQERINPRSEFVVHTEDLTDRRIRGDTDFQLSSRLKRDGGLVAGEPDKVTLKAMGMLWVSIGQMRQHIPDAELSFASSIRYGMLTFGGNHEVLHFNAKGAKGFTSLRALSEVGDQCLFVLLLVGHSCLTCQTSASRRLFGSYAKLNIAVER